MAKRLLPPKGTPEFDAEVAFYLSAATAMRQQRAISLGFTNSGGYTVAMEREGVYLSKAVPKSMSRRYDKPPIIKESCLVIFDTQIPYQDANFLNNLLGLASAWDIKQGISGGDLLNMAAFSIFKENPEDKIWKRERDIAIEVLRALHSHIPKWQLVLGNHESFLIKTLAQQIGHDDILALLGKPEGFIATDYYYCLVKLGGSVWRISHPRNISVIHGRIPQRLADKYEQNIASGHGHLAGFSPSYSGKWMCCDVGITCDPLRLDYSSLRNGTRPVMCQGALILMLSEGKCYPYHLYPNSDWIALRRLYGK